MNGRYLLCICLLSVVMPLRWAEDMKRDASENENDPVLNQGKYRRLFARRRPSHPGQHIPVKPEMASPARRCSRLMENCSPHTPCCDPCASCRCRLFNTICHCWRMGPHCTKSA